MMKKIIITSILCGLLGACGSMSSKEGGDEYSPSAGKSSNNNSFDMGLNEEGSSTTSAAAGSFAPASSKPVPPVTPAHPNAPVSQGALVDAIKSQNDDQIYRVSGQMLTQNPNDVKALNAMAMYYFKKGKVDAAKYLLSKAMAAAPNSGEVYSNMGLVNLANGERREAIKSFRKAMELNGEDGISAANAGSIYVEERDYNKAVGALSTAYNHGVRDAKTMNNYGISLTAVGRFDEAASVFQAAMKDQSNNRELLLNYAILQIDHLNKFKEGMDTLNRLKFVGPPSESRNRIIALENKAKAGLK